MPQGDEDAQASIGLDQFADLPVTLEASLGEARMPIGDVLRLKAGSVVKLAAQLNERIELRLGDKVVARGEIVAVEENFGIRITEVNGAK